MTMKPAPHLRKRYLRFSQIETRWSDNDMYGHVNNVVYYSYFDTVVNAYLINSGVLVEDGSQRDVIGLVVSTSCTYFSPISFPEQIDVGIGIIDSGTSSVRYALAIFKNGGDVAVAQGEYVHVYVDAETRRPILTPTPSLVAAIAALRS
jgi:acyl-CoA thioester hydrolase